MQTVVKYMHRESRGWEVRIPERAATSTELKPASRKTNEALSPRSLEGLQMARQKRRSEFKTSLEFSNHRSLLHPSRVYNCCSPRIHALAHTNRAPHQAESIDQQKRNRGKAATAHRGEWDVAARWPEFTFGLTTDIAERDRDLLGQGAFAQRCSAIAPCVPRGRLASAIPQLSAQLGQPRAAGHALRRPAVHEPVSASS
jgi:hypothetical protein